jgi:phosphatidylinositol alpha-mannosyltransferase
VGNSVPFAANGSVAPVAPDLPAMRRTLAVLADEEPEVLHLHEPLVPGPTLAALLGTHLPTVGTFHASGHVPAYKWARPIMRSWAGRLAARTAVSEDARGLAERWLGGACRVLPNGVDVERFAKADPWPAEERAILFVGRHEPRKGLEVLVEAFASLERGVVLWVVGEGPETARLRAVSSPGVHWLGRISDTELARRLRSAAAFCAPSLHGESFGVVLLEAMAAGTPVVASDIPGYRDVARAGREALLVEPGDPGALSHALREVLDSPSLAAELVDGGRSRAASFSLERLAERYLEIYETL